MRELSYILVNVFTSDLLNPDLTGIGIGIVRRGGFLFITQDFVRFCEKKPAKR